MFKKILLWGVVLVVVALVAVYFVRNMLVEKAVEAGSAYALGVETDLGSAGLEIGGGSLELNNLDVSNPEGFTADNFLSLRHGMFDGRCRVGAGRRGRGRFVHHRGCHSQSRTDRQEGELSGIARQYQADGYVIIGGIPEIPHRPDRVARRKRHRFAQPVGEENWRNRLSSKISRCIMSAATTARQSAR